MGYSFTLKGRTWTDADLEPFGYRDAFPVIMADFASVAGQASADYQAYLTATASGPVVSVNGYTGVVALGNPNNRVINGDMRLASRGSSFTFTSGNGYTLDRWFALSGVSQMIVSQQPNAITWIDRIPSFFLRADCAAGAGQSYVAHRIEDVRSFAGKRITVSFKARAAVAGQTIDRVQVQQNFGSGGDTLGSAIIASNVAPTTTPQQFAFTYDVPSVLGKTLGTNHFLGLLFYYKLSSTTACVIDIADVWIDEVPTGRSAVNRFEERALAVEQTQADRYYERIPVDAAFYASAAGQQIVVPLPFKNRKRAAPALSFATAGTLANGTAALAASADATGGAKLTLTATAAGLVSIAGAIVAVDAEI